jgi:hypothetical protein
MTWGPESSIGQYTAGKPKVVNEVLSTGLSMPSYFGENLDFERNYFSHAKPISVHCTDL